MWFIPVSMRFIPVNMWFTPVSMGFIPVSMWFILVNMWFIPVSMCFIPVNKRCWINPQSIKDGEEDNRNKHQNPTVDHIGLLSTPLQSRSNLTLYDDIYGIRIAPSVPVLRTCPSRELLYDYPIPENRSLPLVNRNIPALAELPPSRFASREVLASQNNIYASMEPFYIEVEDSIGTGISGSSYLSLHPPRKYNSLDRFQRFRDPACLTYPNSTKREGPVIRIKRRNSTANHVNLTTVNPITSRHNLVQFDELDNNRTGGLPIAIITPAASMGTLYVNPQPHTYPSLSRSHLVLAGPYAAISRSHLTLPDLPLPRSPSREELASCMNLPAPTDTFYIDVMNGMGARPSGLLSCIKSLIHRLSFA
ncbi:hypothetical protein FSP39_002585 [Pinctada imbricata]|uniref:Uncharacterized protein n=1 Tax=Pinctada imbricata TaxID=66713 RepID=A0AA88YPR9_PINIB|nr:hypothetical protein FSP39_002585 [Pinctada imbricata]